MIALTCASVSRAESPTFESFHAKAKELTEALPLEQRVGQIFVVGFPGDDLNARLLNVLGRFTPGAVIVFKRNIKSIPQIYRLNMEIHRLSRNVTGLPMMIMVDQEGGNVVRIQSDPNPPSALALGASDSVHLVESIGERTGALLRHLGFTMNLAPVVDLSNPNTQNFVGNRSFGDHPEQVTKIAMDYTRGLLKSKILPTFKHFPGHGNVSQDSHKGLPQKRDKLDLLLERDLVPFSELARMKVASAIMVAHVAFPLIDATGAPATYSKPIVTDILKNRLGYQGLVISDDLQMDGANSGGAVNGRVLKAFHAGNDMLMIAWNAKDQLSSYEKLLSEVRANPEMEERLNASVVKIVQAKLFVDSQELNAAEPPVMNVARYEEIQSDLRRASEEVIGAVLTKEFQRRKDLQGLVKSDQPLSVYSADRVFFEEFQRAAKGPVIWKKLKPQHDVHYSRTPSAASDVLGVFYASGLGTIRKLKSLPARIKKGLIVVNTTEPGSIGPEGSFKAVIQLHTPYPQSGSPLAQFLYQENVAEERSPSADDESEDQ